MKKLALLVAASLVALSTALAGPAKPGIFTHTQKDGTVISLQRFGDEFHHFTLVDGQYTVKQGLDGDYYFATQQNGLFVASDVKVAPIGTLTQQQRKVANQSIGLRPTPRPNTNGSLRDMVQRQAERIITKADGSLADNLSLGRWGADRKQHMNALVILVEYQDVKFVTPNGNQAFHDMLNKKGYSENKGTGSAKDYFEANSCGNFTIDIDVAGPYTLAQNMAFYGGNDSATDQDSLPHYMVAEGCKLAEDAGDITDFTKYDNDNDGYIDMVFIIYAGVNEAEGAPDDTVWPHKSEIGLIPSSYKTTYNGKKLKTYACTSERSGHAIDANGSGMSGIGSFCHEFSHVLGLPDAYDTDYGTPSAFGLSNASIMDHGNYLNDGRTPPAYNILERWLVGWAKPTVIDQSGTYTLESLYTGNGYLLWANNDKNEFFLFENRSKANNASFGWDQALLYGDSKAAHQGGEGMLVYHIDCSNRSNIWNTNSLNANPEHECIKFIRANMSATAENSKEWFFPGARGITELTDKTVPALLSWANTKLKYNIENIEFDGEKVTFEASEVTVSKEVAQYDALINWTNSEHATKYSEWKVTLTDANGNTTDYTSDETTLHIQPLLPGTDYTANICGVGSAGTSEVLHSVLFTTLPAARTPISSFNMEGEYTTKDYIRMSVQNLECTPEQIEWFIDGRKSNSTYVQMTKGEHRICAIITDTEGNKHYLYRYLTIK